MVFSINCPASGDKSFTNFKNAALAFGAAQSSQAAAQSAWMATATSDVYASQTYAPVYHPTVTDTVSLNNQTWTTVYESYPDSPAPTPASAQGVQHRVIVGDNGTLTFNPPSLAAAPRDTIVSGPTLQTIYPDFDIRVTRFSSSGRRTTLLHSPLSVILAASSSLPRPLARRALIPTSCPSPLGPPISPPFPSLSTIRRRSGYIAGRLGIAARAWSLLLTPMSPQTATSPRSNLSPRPLTVLLRPTPPQPVKPRATTRVPLLPFALAWRLLPSSLLAASSFSPSKWLPRAIEIL